MFGFMYETQPYVSISPSILLFFPFMFNKSLPILAAESGGREEQGGNYIWWKEHQNSSLQVTRTVRWNRAVSWNCCLRFKKIKDRDVVSSVKIFLFFNETYLPFWVQSQMLRVLGAATIWSHWDNQHLTAVTGVSFWRIAETLWWQ